MLIFICFCCHGDTVLLSIDVALKRKRCCFPTAFHRFARILSIEKKQKVDNRRNIGEKNRKTDETHVAQKDRPVNVLRDCAEKNFRFRFFFVFVESSKLQKKI